MRHEQPRVAAAALTGVAVPAAAAAIVTAGVLGHVGPGERPAALVLGIAAAGALVLRRRAPVTALVLSGALAFALTALDRRAGAIAMVAPAAALYALSLRGGRRALLGGALAAVVAIALADTVLIGPKPPTLQTAAHIALVALPLLAAEALRNRRAYVRLLLERLELLERTREEEAARRAEQERLRIARDLHDVVAHTLATINVQAGVASHLLDRDPALARTALTTIEAASHEALDDLRAVLGVLREPQGAGAGPGDAGASPLEPAPGLARLDELVRQAQAAGLDVRLAVAGEPPSRIADAVQLAAFRIAQESLTNVRRHAPGAAVEVALAFASAGLHLSVASNGGQAGPADAAARSEGGRPGLGIVGMRERAVALGGSLVAGPCAGGFRVTAELPYGGAA